MVKKIIGLAVLLALGGAAVWYYGFYNTDEAVLRRRIAGLEENLCKDEHQSAIAEAVRLEKLSGYPAADGMTVRSVHEYVDGNYTPTSFASTVVKGGRLCRELEVDFSHIEVKIVKPGFAVVTLEGEAEAELKNGERIDETRDITLDFQKIDGEWKLTGVASEKVVK
ncbi:MAG: hypothetical protein PHI85_05170 [Victivallaceae bacterium]|nr:hypothetical protein [Victivallaceae bacterium]